MPTDTELLSYWKVTAELWKRVALAQQEIVGRASLEGTVALRDRIVVDTALKQAWEADKKVRGIEADWPKPEEDPL